MSVSAGYSLRQQAVSVSTGYSLCQQAGSVCLILFILYNQLYLALRQIPHNLET